MYRTDTKPTKYQDLSLCPNQKQRREFKQDFLDLKQSVLHMNLALLLQFRKKCVNCDHPAQY